MADDTPDTALDVACPYEGGCGAPAGTPCYTSYDGETHAERRRVAALRALDRGTCALCGRLMVRGPAPLDAGHPEDDAAATCPPLPDPRTDWNGYALATQQGLQPGHPGVKHFIPEEAIEHVQAIDYNEVALDARIDVLHGPGAAAAIDAAIADGSIFGGLDDAGPVAVEVGVICPECENGKHQNCGGQALHPVTDMIVACTCEHGAPT